MAFSSGLAAIEAVLKTLSAGDHVVSEENTYGGTTRMFTRVLARLGIEFSFVDSRDPDAVAAVMRPETRLVHVETPTNPTLELLDIPEVFFQLDASTKRDNVRYPLLWRRVI